MNMAGFLLGLIVGCTIAWIAAHACVASECEKLGGFYVGKKTFKCVEIKQEGQQQ